MNTSHEPMPATKANHHRVFISNPHFIFHIGSDDNTRLNDRFNVGEIAYCGVRSGADDNNSIR